MKNFGHPSWKQLLLWDTGELPAEEARQVESHLALCPECREQVDEATSAFDHIAWVDAEAERRKYTNKRNLPGRIIRSHPVTTTTVSLVIAALLLVTSLQWTPEARAETLLTKAIAAQSAGHPPPRFLRIRHGLIDCSVALGTNGFLLHLASSGASKFCDTVSTRLSVAGKQWDSLLSAEQFQQWRHSAGPKKDSVHSLDSFVDVSTTNIQGELKEASLRLRLPDYLPVSAHYEFSGPEPLIFDVEEDHAAEEQSSRKQDRVAKQPQTAAPLPIGEQNAVIDPLDETEAQVRLALHRCQLDSNILLSVERQHGSIQVWGAVPLESDRASAETALHNIDHVSVSLLTMAEEQDQRKPLPWSSYQGDDTPLAEERLTAMFPEGGVGRHQFQNDIDALTRHIVGEAKSRDALLALRSRLSTTQYDRPLESAARTLADVMRQNTTELSVRLSPITGPVSHARPVMSYQQSMQLYTLVHEVIFMGQNKSGLQLAQAVRQTKGLLSTNQSSPR